MAQYEINNDILLISYYMKKNDWNGANKTNYQRILYFSTVLAPVILKDYNWTYQFSYTMYGPRNKDISNQLEVLYSKGLLLLQERKIIANRVEERYIISQKGVETVNTILTIRKEQQKSLWLETIVNVLSIYGEKFLSKLVKEDPNVNYHANNNQNVKIDSSDSSNNLSMELYRYLQKSGKKRFSLNDKDEEEYLMLFFDLLYKKYMGGK